MVKHRLDQLLVQRGLVKTRSQAENYIKLGYVSVGGKVVTKPGDSVTGDSQIRLNLGEQYVSRAALKLASVAAKFKLNFKDKVVLDVGSSTGGFSDYALRHGAKKVIAVDVGTDQLHPTLRGNPKIELHEKTDIRDFELKDPPEMVLIDVSFISLRQVLPHLADLSEPNTQIIAMLKPQFEAGQLPMRRASLPSSVAGRAAGAFGAESHFSSAVLARSTKRTTPSVPQGEKGFGIQTHRQLLNKGVIKNDRIRRQILKDFELWSKNHFVIRDKADSEVAGTHGNQERFYLLQKIGLEK